MRNVENNPTHRISSYPQIKQMGSQILIKTLMFLISSMLSHLKLSRVIFAALKLLETFPRHLSWKVSSSGAFGFDISWLGSGCPLRWPRRQTLGAWSLGQPTLQVSNTSPSVPYTWDQLAINSEVSWQTPTFRNLLEPLTELRKALYLLSSIILKPKKTPGTEKL